MMNIYIYIYIYVWLRAPASVWFSGHSLCTFECGAPKTAAVPGNFESSEHLRASQACIASSSLASNATRGPPHISTLPTIIVACNAGGGVLVHKLFNARTHRATNKKERKEGKEPEET